MTGCHFIGNVHHIGHDLLARLSGKGFQEVHDAQGVLFTAQVNTGVKHNGSLVGCDYAAVARVFTSRLFWMCIAVRITLRLSVALTADGIFAMIESSETLPVSKMDLFIAA
ncbi:hypothetical protein D3C75_939970 [compost metagenome]